MKPPRVLEKVVQQQGVQLLRTLGAQVYVVGTRRPKGDYAGTCQSPGIPDVMAFLPTRRSPETRQDAPGATNATGGATHVSPGRLVLVMWEAKAPEGRLRPEQAVFRDNCRRAAVAHVTGDFQALVTWLLAEGYLLAANVPHYRLPKGGQA